MAGTTPLFDFPFPEVTDSTTPATDGATEGDFEKLALALEQHLKPVRCVGTLTSQSVAAVGAVLAWDAVTETGGDFWDAGTPTEIQAPIDGLYIAKAQLRQISGVDDGDKTLQIIYGSGFGTYAEQSVTPIGWAGGTYVSVPWLAEAGDVIQFSASKAPGAAANFEADVLVARIAAR